MSNSARTIGIALAAALVATTALTPLASAQEWQHHRAPQHEQEHGSDRGRGHDDAAAWIGLGIAAFAGAALIANAAQPQAVYAPPPAYVQPSYAQPAYVQSYAPPAYVQPAYVQPPYAEPPYAEPPYAEPGPTCTTINGYAACLGPDGTWQYVR